MKDCFNILQEKYFEELNGNLASNGNNVPVYDSASVPANVSQPYVLLSNMFASEQGEGSKESYGQEVFVQVDVYCKNANSFGGKKQVSIISDQIIQRIRTRQVGYLDLGPDFYMILSELDNTNTTETLVADGMLVQRTIRFKHIVQEV